jgi:hypothetical protein
VVWRPEKTRQVAGRGVGSASDWILVQMSLYCTDEETEAQRREGVIYRYMVSELQRQDQHQSLDSYSTLCLLNSESTEGSSGLSWSSALIWL